MGCLPILVIVFIVLVLIGGGDGVEERRPEPARPLPGGVEELIPMPSYIRPEYAIEDPGAQQDSQGTAFAVSPEGLWLTAEHVVNGCDRLGLATSPRVAARVSEIYESSVSDAAVIADGIDSPVALPLALEVPEEGAPGWHMGFPSSRPAVVESRFLGQAGAIRNRAGTAQPVLAWAEVRRIPEFDHTLGGISGGPTLDAQGQVVGINSASSDRRGRVLTTHPAQARNLLRAARQTPAATLSAPIVGPGAAAERFQQLYDAGAIRHVYCDVLE